MSFAQGLLAGTQAARNVMDSYKEARDARVQREFAQGLAALDEQGAGPKQFTPDMMPEAAPDPNAPTNMAGLANTPQMTAPTMPLSPQQRLQQQIALANRLGLRQEAANFTNQLGQLTQREEDMRYRAQRDTMSDIDRERERQDRLEQTSIDRNLRAANDALQYQLAQERQGIAQSAENREADAAAAQQQRAALEQLYASNTSKFFSGEDTTALFNPDIPKEQLGMYSQIIAEKLERDFGVTQREFRMREGQIKEDALKTLNIDFSKQPEKRIRALQDLATRVYDSNPYDDVKLRIVPTPDVEGGIVVYEGNQVRGQFNSMDELQEAITDAVTNNAGSLAYKNLMDERKLLEALSAQDKRDFEIYKINDGMRVEYAKQIAKLTTSQSYLNKAPNIQLKMENNIRRSFGMPLLEGAQGLANKQAGETGATPTAQEFLEELSGSSMYNLPR